MMQGTARPPLRLPVWIPDAIRLYLDHTEEGMSLRALARREDCHASTVLRLVRRCEKRREDPLLDEALMVLARTKAPTDQPVRKDHDQMSAPLRSETMTVDEQTLKREGLRVLRRLSEAGSVLAIAPDLERAVVMREFADGRSARTGVVERVVAQAFVLKEWIACRRAGRVSSYEITAAGRAALKRLIAEDDAARLASGMAEAPMAFADRQRILGEGDAPGEAPLRRARPGFVESPVSVLGRRRDKDGRLFLEPELVVAAERLREDFELAQSGPRVAQNWDRFLTGADRNGPHGEAGLARGPAAARDRVAAALRDLGPGLGDVALRVCCFLEGIETAEQRMGWAARSGKIVLRIALQRLCRHYEETYGKHGPMIG